MEIRKIGRSGLNWFNSRCWITKNILYVLLYDPSGRLFSWNHYSNLGLMANKYTTKNTDASVRNHLRQAFAGLWDCFTRLFEERRKIQQKKTPDG